MTPPLQQVRLLFRGGDLTSDGSGLGVGVPGSGRSGFAAATHGTPSSGGLACRPDNDVGVQRRGDLGFSHGRPPVPSPPAPPSPPLLLSSCGRQGEIPKRWRIGDVDWGGFIGRRPRVPRHGRMVQMWPGDAWPPSRGASTAGWWWPWGRRGGLPAPTMPSRGERQRKRKKVGERKG
jgi:hypothetical protein